MRPVRDLCRSLYNLTKIPIFNNIADTLDKAQRTKDQVDQVQRDAKRAKDSFGRK